MTREHIRRRRGWSCDFICCSLPINSQCNFQRAPIATASHKFFIRQINIRTIKQVGNLALLPLTGWNTIISLMAWTWCTICAPLISRHLAVLSSKLRRYHLLECAIFLHLVLYLLGNEQFNSDANTISPLIGILIGCQRSEVKRSLPWNFPPTLSKWPLSHIEVDSDGMRLNI